MSFFKRMSQLEKLLPPGKYAELAAKEAAQAWKPGELSRLVVPPRVSSVSPKFSREFLEQWERIAKENPSPENIKLLNEIKKDLLGELESRPPSLKEQAAEDRLNKILGPEEKQPEVLTKEQMREKRKLDEAAEKTQKIEEDSDKTPLLNSDLAKKAAVIAGLTGGGFAASSLTPEEAEASPETAAKKAALKLYHATSGPFVGEKLKAGKDKLIHFGTKEQAADRFRFLDKSRPRWGAETIPILADIKNPLELSDIGDWNAFKMALDMQKRGIIDKNQIDELIARSKKIKGKIGRIDKQVLLDFITKELGYDAIKYKNIYEASEADKIIAAAKVNPEMAKIPDLRAQKASLESQLLDASGNPKPSSRETDKIHDQINEIDKQLRPLQNKLQSTFEEGADYSYAVPQEHGGILRSKISGKPLAIGGAVIGAGILANSSSAHADEGPTVSQSNPEFSSSSAPKPFVLPSFAEKALKTQAFLGKMEEEGKLAPDVTSYLYDTAYKYGIDPAKRKVMGLLTGKDVPEEETPSYSDIYKQGFENIGKENVGKFLKGFASAAAEDPTGTTQDLIQSAKDEDVADYVANTAAGVSELAEDPLAPFMAGVGKLPKTMRTLSKFRPK